MTFERAFLEQFRVVLFDPRKLLRDDGTIKPLAEWDDDTAAAISRLEVTEEVAGDARPRSELS
jgi:hypothetical protein